MVQSTRIIKGFVLRALKIRVYRQDCWMYKRVKEVEQVRRRGIKIPSIIVNEHIQTDCSCLVARLISFSCCSIKHAVLIKLNITAKEAFVGVIFYSHSLQQTADN